MFEFAGPCWNNRQIISIKLPKMEGSYLPTRQTCGQSFEVSDFAFSDCFRSGRFAKFLGSESLNFKEFLAKSLGCYSLTLTYQSYKSVKLKSA